MSIIFRGAVSAVLCILKEIFGLGMNLWRLMLLLNFLQEQKRPSMRFCRAFFQPKKIRTTKNHKQKSAKKQQLTAPPQFWAWLGYNSGPVWWDLWVYKNPSKISDLDDVAEGQLCQKNGVHGRYVKETHQPQMIPLCYTVFWKVIN